MISGWIETQLALQQIENALCECELFKWLLATISLFSSLTRQIRHNGWCYVFYTRSYAMQNEKETEKIIKYFTRTHTHTRFFYHKKTTMEFDLSKWIQNYCFLFRLGFALIAKYKECLDLIYAVILVLFVCLFALDIFVYGFFKGEK